MIALLAAASLWIGSNLSAGWEPTRPPRPGSFEEQVVATKSRVLWVAVGYEHPGDFFWPAGRHLWFKTPAGWIRDSLMAVRTPRGRVVLGKQMVVLDRDLVVHDRGKRNGKWGALIFVALPGPVDVKILEVEAR